MNYIHRIQGKEKKKKALSKSLFFFLKAFGFLFAIFFDLDQDCSVSKTNVSFPTLQHLPSSLPPSPPPSNIELNVVNLRILPEEIVLTAGSCALALSENNLNTWNIYLIPADSSQTSAGTACKLALPSAFRV